ncbi:MAG TPA: TIGR03435 family protein [Terracidiphilus sp.]
MKFSSLAVAFAMTLTIVLCLVNCSPISAQAAAPNPAQDITGTWQGTLHAGQNLRIVLKISKADGGGYKAENYSIDQGGQPIPVDKITLDGSTFKMSVKVINGSYEGKLSADGKSITGNWTQGSPVPLNFERTTPETEWAIPKPPPPIPPMAADANPSFEVATIKPSKPDDQRKAFIVRGNEFHIINQPLTQMISFAFDVQAKQVIGLPDWAESDKFDIDGKPDGEGAPNGKQWKIMIQKLLADRFGLKFHKDKKELSVYVLSVSKTGEKMTKNDSSPNGLPGLFFQGLGKLNVRNALMSDFTGLMQSAVLDRPVVDQTGLTGRFDFSLNWTPDDSQFGGMGAKVPPPTDTVDAPPNLYTAIQEQIGLKLEATRAPADVMVIDNVQKPSSN